MSRLIYTTEQLIRSVRLRGRVPNTNIPGTGDSDIVILLNENMRTFLFPALMKPHQDYFSRTIRITLSSGVYRYRIPERAGGLKLKEIAIIDGDTRKPLPRMFRKEETLGDTTGLPVGFFLEAAHIVFLPQTCAMSGEAELIFYCRPGDLVTEDEYVLVDSVPSTTELTLETTIPDSWTNDNLFDVHSPDSGGEVRALRRTVSTISGTQVIFNEAIDGSVAGDTPVQAGDYLVLTGTAAVPALPAELHVPLVLAASSSLTAGINPDLSVRLWNEFQEALRFLGYLTDGRVETPSQKVGNQANELYGQTPRTSQMSRFG